MPQQETKSGGTWFGPFIWVAVGAVIATVYQKVTSFIANPQAAQARMMSWVSFTFLPALACKILLRFKLLAYVVVLLGSFISI